MQLAESENASQLIHMKHFEELVTAFLYDKHLGSPSSRANVLFESASFSFLDFLFIHVSNSCDINHSRDWRNASIDNLTAIQNTWKTFWTRARPSRVAFQMILLIRRFMVLEVYKLDEMVPELMRAAIRG